MVISRRAHYQTTIDPEFKDLLFQSVSRFLKRDWGILPDEDKEANDKAITMIGQPVLGLYKAGSYEIAVIIPKERDKLEIILKHELGKERLHAPVIYDHKGNRITQ